MIAHTRLCASMLVNQSAWRFGLVLATLPMGMNASASEPALSIGWSKPLAKAEAVQPSVPTGLQLVQAASSPGGNLVFLARNGGEQLLLPHTSQDGPGPAVPLYLPGWAMAITAYDASVWVVGYAPSKIPVILPVPGLERSAGYVTSVSSDGRVEWEKSYGGLTFRVFQSIDRLPSGDLVVAARDNNTTRLAKLTAQGRPVWVRRMGLGKGAVVSAGEDGRILLIALEAEGESGKTGYVEHVSAWTLDGAGEVISKTRLRENINDRASAHFARLSVARSGKTVFVASSWSDGFRHKEVEVAAIDGHGTVPWTFRWPDTVFQPSNRGWVCEPALAATEAGDLLVACAARSSIMLALIDRLTGEARRGAVPLPECHSYSMAKLFLAERAETQLAIAGSRPSGNVAQSCTWLGTLTWADLGRAPNKD